MIVTLLLPTIEPYGCPVTFFDPYADYLRKRDFFKWVASVDKKTRPYQNVELLISEEIEIQQGTHIEGEQQSQTSFVPSGT